MKEINKAKKDAIKDPTVTADAALVQRLQAALSSNKKITKAEEKLVSGVEKKCADAPEPRGDLPGRLRGCGAGRCLGLREQGGRCEACLKIEAFDGLDLDCDLADDQIANMSCPVQAAPTPTPTPVPATPTPTPPLVTPTPTADTRAGHADTHARRGTDTHAHPGIGGDGLQCH